LFHHGGKNSSHRENLNFEAGGGVPRGGFTLEPEHKKLTFAPNGVGDSPGLE